MDKENPLLRELQKTNEIMTTLVKKMKRHDSRLQAIENQLSYSGSSASGSSATSVSEEGCATRLLMCRN